MTAAEYMGTAYLFGPMLGGGIIHGLCVKFSWLSVLTLPVDGGLRWRGHRVFGANKTVRGFVAVAVGCALVMALQSYVLHDIRYFRSIELFDYGSVNGWTFGAMVGLFAMLAELPNSFLKRQLGIHPGSTTHGAAGVFFYLVDQVDIILGIWLAFALVMNIKLTWIAFSLLLVAVAHQLLTWITYALGMRASPR